MQLHEALRKNIRMQKLCLSDRVQQKNWKQMRKTVRSDVDFVITFEELDAMFEARGIDPKTIESQGHLHDATAAGRGYAGSRWCI